VGIAGRTALDYLLGMFKTVPTPEQSEYIFIVGPYLGETQIPEFIAKRYPQLRTHFVVQGEMKGQSHALYLARQYLAGPMVMCFSDTLLEIDFSFLEREKADGVACVKAVDDPRRFGVAEVNTEGWVSRLIEKPTGVENKLAVVGCYYFKSGEELIAAIEEQMRRDVALRNEFFLADAINILLERGALMRVEKVETWLDTGTIASTLETNRYLLTKYYSEIHGPRGKGVKIKSPAFIHEEAEVESSTIGPYASIGAGCKISGSRVEDSIIEAGCEIRDCLLKGSLIGRQARVLGNRSDNTQGKGAGRSFQLHVGDNSSVIVG